MKSQYTQDVEFNSGFGALQAPVHLFTAAAICGVDAPKPNRPFRYLDLGCGNGLTLSLLADAYPHGEFVGIDINPEHISKAQDRATRAELGNVTFETGDVIGLVAGDLGEFDFCVMSGAYSWLDAPRRAATRNYLSAVVRPGGLVYLDYSAQPGIAQVAPLYHLLRELRGAFPGNSAEQLSAAAKFADRMRKEGARFFEVHSVAAARLKTILANPPTDEAHEVFNLQENGLWSNEVIDSMALSDFAYLGSAGLHHNLSALTPDAGAALPGEDSPVALQQLMFDIRWNVAQRRDVYIRQGKSEKPQSLAELLGDLPIYAVSAALETRARQELCKHFPGYNFVATEAEKYAQIITSVRTFDELFKELQATDIAVRDGEAITRHFLATRLVSIAAATPAAASDKGEVRMASTLNRNILLDDIGEEYARPFASPVAGSRVLLPLKDRLYLWSLVGNDLADAWDRLGHLQQVFRGKNNEQLSRDDFVRIIESSMPGFRKHALPELLRLGIVQAAHECG